MRAVVSWLLSPLLGLLLATPAFESSQAQRSPDLLPAVTIDCYQSFAAKAKVQDLPSREVALDAGNPETPTIRYRLQVVKETILKIIKDPDRPAFRTEHGKSVWDMARDFTEAHKIIGWREQLPGGVLRFYTMDFEDLLFTTIDSSPATPTFSEGLEVHVMKCRAAN